MIAYQKEKVENAICFFAKEYKKHTRQYIHQTNLYKYMAFIDFYSVRDTGHPVFGLDYIAWKKGPVPPKIYNKRDNYETNLFTFLKIDKEKNEYIIVPKENAKLNLDYFSEYEIKKMQETIFIFADSSIKTKQTSQASHEKILAWQKAWNRKPNSIIDFGDMFDNLDEKKEEELTPAEENYLMYRALSTIEKNKN